MADPTWQNTIAYDGLELRNSDSAFVMSDGTALGSRPGVRPGDPGLTTTLAGSTINVSAGVGVLYRSNQGVYRAALPASTSPGTVNAAHATLPRVDLVYLRVWDTDVDASGLRKAEAVYLAGTAAASPVAPTPAGTQIYIPLATISVPASGGGSPSVSTAVRPVTVAPGGILPDSSSTGVYVGQYRDNVSTGALERWSGSAWVPWSSFVRGVAPAGATGTFTGQYRDNTITLVQDRWDGSAWTTTEQPTASLFYNAISLSSHASTYFALSFAGGGLAMSNRASMWSAGQPTRLVLPLVGTYVVDGYIQYPGTLGANDARGEVRVNGTSSTLARVGTCRGSSGSTSVTIGGRVIATSANQYVEIFCNQNSGVTAALVCQIGVTRVSANTT